MFHFAQTKTCKFPNAANPNPFDCACDCACDCTCGDGKCDCTCDDK